MVKRKAAPYCTGIHQFDDFPLGHNSVREVQTPVLPLHRAVQIQSVTQPEIRGTPCRKTKGTMMNETLLYAVVCCIRLNYKSLPENPHVPGLELFGTE